MPESVSPNSREEYEKTVQWARDNKSWSMLNAMVEDGYSSDVDWRSLRSKETK
jgi:hypothetical protein